MKTLTLFALIFISNLCLSQSRFGPNDPGYLLGDWTWSDSQCNYDVPISIEASDSQDAPNFVVASAYSCVAPDLIFSYLTKMSLPWSVESSQNDLLQFVGQPVVGDGITFTLFSVDKTSFYFTAYIANYYVIPIQVSRNLSNTTNTSECDFTIDTTEFDICALAAVDATPVFAASDALGGKLSFSLAQNDTSQSIWATYVDNNGVSYVVAAGNPAYSFLDSTDPTKGIQIIFPESQDTERNFQLFVNLACDLNIVGLVQTSFDVSITADVATNLEIMLAQGSSIYACPTFMYNPADLTPGSDTVNDAICASTIDVSGFTFNVCPLNLAGVYNASDILGGHISFSVSTKPLAKCGNEQTVWGIYHDNAFGCYQVATRNPTFTLMNETDPGQGLQLTYPVRYPLQQGDRSFKTIVNLICSPADVDPTLIVFTTDVFVMAEDNIEILTVTGNSIYGCPFTIVDSLTRHL